MGGPPVPKEIQELIIRIWMELRSTGDEPVAKEVLESARQYFHSLGQSDVRLPKLRKVQDILRQARKITRNLPESEIVMGEPWTMAALNKYELPAESIPYVVKVWRYAVNTNELFTIRQAKWVARLYRLIDDIPRLWFWSRKYSKLEEVSVITGEPMDTYVPDTALCMGCWEEYILRCTDFRKGKLINYGTDRILPVADDGSVIEELLHGIESPHQQIRAGKFNLRDQRLSDLVRKLPPINSLGLEYEARMVYLRLFTYLIKGPKWKDLTPEDALDVIVKLREWVLDKQDEILRRTPGRSFEQTPIHEIFGIYPVPDDLLVKVGYEYAKGRTNERTY